MVHLPFRLCSVYLLLFTNTFHKVLIILIGHFPTLNCKPRFREDRRISVGVHVEEATLKGHYAPRFNSTMRIILNPPKIIWFRANAAKIYKRSSVESSSVPSEGESIASVFILLICKRRVIGLWQNHFPGAPNDGFLFYSST